MKIEWVVEHATMGAIAVLFIVAAVISAPLWIPLAIIGWLTAPMVERLLPED